MSAAAASWSSLGLVAVFVLVVVIAMPASAAAHAQPPAPPPTSDGTSIDQGIAYVLMLVALVLTYLIHPLDATSPYKLF
ncbi:arabinogalactan protein 22-like [Phragmites australis]|nr:arabinogalactan protein 22-like [Phragmites australis]